MMLSMVVAEDLSDAERRIWDAFPTGKLVEFGTGNAEDDDPAAGESWGPERQVRAEVLAALLCGAVEVEPWQAGEIYIARARVIGKLELSGATAKHRLRLRNCYAADGIDLTEATTRTLDLRGSHVGAMYLYDAKINGTLMLSGAHLDGTDGRALAADRLTVTGNIICDWGFHADGEVRLHTASVGGQLNLRSAHLHGTEGHALTGDGLTVADGMFCDEGFHAYGEVRLVGASIRGPLHLDGAYLDGIDGPALTADGLNVADIFCRDQFQAHGNIHLHSASIRGALDLRGAHLDGNGRPALTADGVMVTGNIICNEGFQADGEVRLHSAGIGSQLNFRSAHLDGEDGPALTANRLTVAGNMYCDEGFQADGTVDLSGASVGSQLIFSGAHLSGKDGPALDADGLTVTGDMYCDEGFQADREVRLSGARLGSQLIFSGAHLSGKDGPALTADGLTVTGDMYCAERFQADGTERFQADGTERFQADGTVDLSGACIGSQLIFSGAHLNGEDGPALIANRLTVAGNMCCDRGFQADGTVDVAGAKIGTLVDEAESWPQALVLDGLTYGDLTDMPVRQRLDWLSRSGGYSPQPYEELAAYYRRLGHDDEARRVLLAKQRRRRRQLAWWKRSWGWFQDGIAGYGYAPGRALLLLAGAFIAGWLVFRHRQPVPVGPGPHPAFNAALYTLDVLIPAPALGQASDFDPQGAGLVLAAGLHVFGWLLAITVIAAITRSFSRT